MAIAKLKDATLHYEFEGAENAPVVVLSNSLGTDLHMWDAQMDALGEHFRVLRYDTRGHGESEVVAGPYAIEDLGGDVIGLMDLLGIERAHVCGVSLGGLTAMWLAIHAPRRVGRIMPSNTAARLGTEAMWEERIRQVTTAGLASIADATMQRWFTAAFRERNAQRVETVRKVFCANDATGYAGCCAALRGADLRPRLGEIQAAALAVSGTHDAVTPPADGRYLEAHITGARYVEMNAAHLSNMEDAERFTQQMVQFFL